MLRSIIPNSRMMEFRYPKKDGSPYNLRKLADAFLQCFSRKRGPPDIPVDSSPSRPIIFIAYGHGGLILELAIMVWYNQQLAPTLVTSPQAKEPPKSSVLPPKGAMPSGPTAETPPPTVSVTSPDARKEQRAIPLNQGQPSTSTSEATKEQSLEGATTPTVDAASPKETNLLQPSQLGEKPRRSSVTSRKERGSTESTQVQVSASEMSKSKPTSSPLPALSDVAGIVLLGSPLKIPLISLEEAGVSKTDEKPDKKSEDKPTLEKLLEACLRNATFKDTTEDQASTIYHTCFESIVNKFGIATQYYRGSDQYDAERGEPFKVCSFTFEFIILMLHTKCNERIIAIQG